MTWPTAGELPPVEADDIDDGRRERPPLRAPRLPRHGDLDDLAMLRPVGLDAAGKRRLRNRAAWRAAVAAS